MTTQELTNVKHEPHYEILMGYSCPTMSRCSLITKPPSAIHPDWVDENREKKFSYI